MARVVQVGPDRVTVSEAELIIQAKRPMADWQVRELNPIPIYFEDRKFFLVEIRKSSPPFAVRYLLHPWPEGNVKCQAFHSYDAESVAERDAARRQPAMRWCLPVQNSLSVLWSAQQRLVRFSLCRTRSQGSPCSPFFIAIRPGCFASDDPCQHPQRQNQIGESAAGQPGQPIGNPDLCVGCAATPSWPTSGSLQPLPARSVVRRVSGVPKRCFGRSVIAAEPRLR